MPNTCQLNQLLGQIKQCQLCAKHLPLGPKPIVQLASNAKILIAGQAPGQKTHHKGHPFDDASGNRLRQWLGVSKEQFYDADLFAIMPMGFCFPGSYTTNDNKSGDKPPRPECEIWRQPLLNQLHKVELTLLVGQYAIEWHLKQKLTVTNAVAQWQDFWPHTLVMPHPSPRNNIWLKRHPEFEQLIIPKLQQRVAELITTDPV
ncbi:uracil-DNA glycosylase family protein [Shewanella youngdeokensis]|uniref:Uracil-DNA glycosylase family protein n=1 Tax=Shewanella youngdeokensis TaxID=2999068 RepID=A0ABZ0JUY0_9GAMM|nr:uracil-DNA glycosylase family protein [Shewanella sp. DAU334]